MVALDIVRKANSSLGTTAPRLVSLFVGGTSGIGKSTLRQLALNTDSPVAYIVGRSESNAAPLLKELGQINPRGSFNFIEADVSLMSNVDKACESIRQKEKALNLLFMTPGGLSLVGRRETTEGLDKLFALRYYARMRFVQNLMPLLEAAQPTTARVVSVLGGGFEGNINTKDLDLKESYNIVSCAMHSVTMTSLAMEHLAAQHPVSFVHVYPGLVGTNIYTNSFPAPMAAVYNYGMWPMMWPFSVNLEESGQRHLFHSTSARYPANNATIAQGTPVPEGIQLAMGSNGTLGSGAYLMNWKGETSAAGKKMQRLRERGFAQKIWEHTTSLTDRAASEKGTVGQAAAGVVVN
ncbi:putative short-chain dehydrogenases/reductase [Acrodontium crateriforme]|uniref:Short-chain dehydrogenases/reductase n=1 Tax=Acrodontium crateriforme TaxID=150365 RepID=A0AAQ3MBJ3_9PEZI|nr:putative short-chain dehydrogenases/reductase [Acrodontium crateriforme]